MEIIIENKSGSTFKDVDLFSFETLPFPVKVNIKDRVEKFRNIRIIALKNDDGKIENYWAYINAEIVSPRYAELEEGDYPNIIFAVYNPFNPDNDFTDKGLSMEKAYDVFLDEGCKLIIEKIHPYQKTKIVLS